MIGGLSSGCPQVESDCADFERYYTEKAVARELCSAVTAQLPRRGRAFPVTAQPERGIRLGGIDEDLNFDTWTIGAHSACEWQYEPNCY
jgi:hypothetical protein